MYLQWNRHNTLQSGELDSTHNSLDATLAIAYTHKLVEARMSSSVLHQQGKGEVSLGVTLYISWQYKWRTRMEPRRPPVWKILLHRWYRAPRLPCVLAGHKTSAPCVIDACVAFLSRLLVLFVFFPMGTSAWQCFV